jgi:hypothetical protein
MGIMRKPAQKRSREWTSLSVTKDQLRVNSFFFSLAIRACYISLTAFEASSGFTPGLELSKQAGARGVVIS